MSALYKFGAATVAAAWALTTMSAAHATNRYAVACVHNKTDVPIHYQIRWADSGVWQSHTLRPGYRTSFAHRYARQNENRSPELLVRFDSDMRSKRFDIEYKLDKRAAAGDQCEEGRQYHFRYEPKRRDLIDITKG